MPRKPDGRYVLELPNGERVTVTVTPEILAIAARVKVAVESGGHPDPSDLAALILYLAEDT